MESKKYLVKRKFWVKRQFEVRNVFWLKNCNEKIRVQKVLGTGFFLDHKFDIVTYNIYSEDKLNVSVTYNRDTSPD